jgi:hypothetical protein
MTRRARLANRTAGPQRIFTLKIEGKPGTAIRSLRALLKVLLRRHRFRCLDAREGDR